MAGGLFQIPFHFNIKCIIFSIICMGLFLFKPVFDNQYYLYLSLFIIFVISYVAMAWYDYYFNCDILPLKRGKYSWQQYIKPPTHEPKKQLKNINPDTNLDTNIDTNIDTNLDTNLDTNTDTIDEKREYYLIYALHILFIVPLLAYLALYRNKVNPIVYPILGVLAAFTLFYHGFSFIASVH